MRTQLPLRSVPELEYDSSDPGRLILVGNPARVITQELMDHMREAPKKPLWRCPKCGHRFVTKNLWHACGRYRLSDHFKGKPPARRQTFDRYVKLAKACGPVTVYAQKTRIVIQARVRFAGAVVHRDFLEVTIWLKRRTEHPHLDRVEPLGSLGFNHHLRLTNPGDADKSLGKLIREAYILGSRRGEPTTVPG